MFSAEAAGAKKLLGPAPLAECEATLLPALTGTEPGGVWMVYVDAGRSSPIEFRVRAKGSYGREEGPMLPPAAPEEVRVSLGPARLGAVTPASPRVTEWDRVAWTEGEAQRTDRLADWEFSVDAEYRAGPRSGIDVVPLSVDLGPCGLYEAVLTVVIRDTYELEIEARAGVAIAQWLGTFSLGREGTATGEGRSQIVIDGDCVSSLTVESWKIGRAADNVGDPNKLRLVITDVQTVYDTPPDELLRTDSPACLLGSLRELGYATMLATNRLLSNVQAAAANPGEPGLVSGLNEIWEFSLPITEDQIKYDASEQWMFVVRPTPRPSTD